MKTAGTAMLDLSSLPEQAQQEITDFYKFLKTKYRHRTTSMRKTSGKKESAVSDFLTESGFVGMWKDRPEMSDPAKWVKELRE